MKVFTIVVSFNAEKWISKCLNSVQDSSVQSSIIVVDNNSSDNTRKIVDEEFPNVRLVESNVNLGFGKGNNLGLKEAMLSEADYCLLLNQDALLEHKSLSNLIELSKGNPEYGIIGPINLNADGSGLERDFLKELNSSNCPNFVSDLFLTRTRNIYDIKNYINASCWLITNDCLNKIGGFDPLFSHYGEDIDYCQRAKYHSYKVGLATQARIYHAKDNHNCTSNSIREFMSDGKVRYLNNYLLPKLKDLNKKFISHYIEELLVLLYLLFRSMITLSIKHIILYFKILVFLLVNGYKILRHRKICKYNEAPFLRS